MSIFLSFVRWLFNPLVAWFDSDSPLLVDHQGIARFIRCLPFIVLHLGCFAVFLVGFSEPALWLACFLYFFRVFSLTAFYHRYFSHRSYKTSRFWQFIFAICGLTAAQRGPLWWAAHHRAHHLYADTEKDAHSPRSGFLRSHLGWFTEATSYRTEYNRIQDFSRYPELVFLNRFDSLIPIFMIVLLYFFGEALAPYYPDVSGWQFVVWGGCISTIFVYHATFCVNSICHLFGSQRYKGNNDSRNNWLVALLTFGEGWHNNHHHYPSSTKQGFYWWEIDITYYILRLMQFIGIIKDIKTVPDNVLQKKK